jgi:hypothetical protein
LNKEIEKKNKPSFLSKTKIKSTIKFGNQFFLFYFLQKKKIQERVLFFGNGDSFVFLLENQKINIEVNKNE